MTSHNLAVVFGPTLFRVADNENLLTKQGQINVFVELLISHFYDIFPNEPREGHFHTTDHEETDEDDIDHDDHNHDCTEEEMSETEAEADYTTEAIAVHDFTARSTKEISFNKGDKIKIYTKTTPDWWDAKVDGRYGYVPVSYIKIVDNSAAPTGKGTGLSSGDGHPSNESKKERKKSSEHFTPLDHLDGVSLPTDLEEGISDGEGDHCSNVFAAIDPTCGPDSAVMTKKSPNNSRRGHSPTRTKGINSKNNVSDLDSSLEDESASHASLHPTPKSAAISRSIVTTHTYPPPSGGLGHSHSVKSATNPMFVVSQQDLFANKLRSTSESHEDKKLDDGQTSPVFSSEGDMLSRDRPLSFKDKSQLFSKNLPPASSVGPDAAGIIDRPQSQVLRPVLGHMRIESADRPSPAPNFKPPPPPALKPKPSVRKKENGSQTSVNSKEDNTRF